MAEQAGWRFAIDRGGTFTDVVAVTPAGRLVTAKLLSEDPARYDDAASEAVARLVAQYGDGPINEIRLGTTVATNALLERKGERLALVTTSGFGDALRIGNQARPEIFARHILLPDQLPDRVMEVEERLDAAGSVLKALDRSEAETQMRGLREEGYNALAIVLMHGWKNPQHEQALAKIARDLGFSQVSVSHEVAPLIKLVPRGDTTVVDAYLSPVLNRYIDGLRENLPNHRQLTFMQSNGGLADASSFRGKDAILSGPAGGVVGMVKAAKRHAFERLIGFDMGGTSTDVAHYAGEYELNDDGVIAGVRIAAPSMSINTVAAGGGSICSYDGSRFRVGPESAGANPGPACYGKGGPLTVTDCNLILGRIDPAYFPQVFGNDGRQPLDKTAAKQRLVEISEALSQPLSLEEIAEGFLQIAVNNMANAIRKISVARGHDVTRYAMVCFGGAGGQHAACVADDIGIDRIIVPPLASLLSAYGIGLAPLKTIKEKSILRPLFDGFRVELEELCEAARDALLDQGVSQEDIALIRRARLRFSGSDSTLTIECSDPESMDAAFRTRHRGTFGFSDENAEIIIDALSVEANGNSGNLSEIKPEPVVLEVNSDGDWPAISRADLRDRPSIDGPQIILDEGTTTVVEPGWQAELAEDGSIILTRTAPRQSKSPHGTKIDPIQLEIFNNRFMVIAEEMGLVLQSTATSVNIKERLDFSCAIFDADGSLIANAPHIPVHLGSMGDSIRRIIEARGASAEGGPADGRGIRRGDAYMLNDPYNGGTHLPDITVIVPVFYTGDSETPDAFVAARGHHADIGGIAPGSMPPESTTIEQEGILLDNILLADEGRFCEVGLRAALSQGEWPARNIDRNLSDLRAQLAACTRGAELLSATSEEYGPETVDAFMGYVLDNAEEAVRRLIGTLDDGEFAYQMDNGAEVKVAIRVDRDKRSAVFDFTGTSAQLADNFNAPRSIARAASLYVLRTLIDDAIPLNDGCLRPVELIIPNGSILAPSHPAAVVAGNVETSQVVTDALFAATGRLACAQGTMNNFTFGNERHQYYETIAGGSGAGIDHPGTSAVQTHMTNSRLTDPEVLETRLPVRVEKFAIREGSAGRGEYSGGNGVERVITFLEPMRANILANRRKHPPRGLAGGSDAAPGENWIERVDGSREDLPACGSVEMQIGDRFIIRTPGGGGFGSASEG